MSTRSFRPDDDIFFTKFYPFRKLNKTVIVSGKFIRYLSSHTAEILPSDRIRPLCVDICTLKLKR